MGIKAFAWLWMELVNRFNSLTELREIRVKSRKGFLLFWF